MVNLFLIHSVMKLKVCSNEEVSIGSTDCITSNPLNFRCVYETVTQIFTIDNADQKVVRTVSKLYFPQVAFNPSFMFKRKKYVFVVTSIA